jgi:formate C-acetyltransferase
LKSCRSFDEFINCIDDEVNHECNEIIDGLENLWMIPAPFMSVLMDGCIERARDISEGSKYNNYGIHGTGLSTASDSLAVIKKYIFDDDKVSKDEIINAIDADFEGYDDLLAEFRYDAPKVGNDEYAGSIAFKLLDIFAKALEFKRNEMGGCFRAGTGSAMYYIWHAKEIGASPNGRKKGEAFEANMAPALNTRVKGPVSIIKSFTRGDYKKTINGGPLTIELHDTVFRNEDGLKKVSMLVKYFMDMGGHQLQLNAVNRENLLDAQKHPEQHRHLIVRVWGWSAYFVELDKEYQNHIIQRVEMMV